MGGIDNKNELLNDHNKAIQVFNIFLDREDIKKEIEKNFGSKDYLDRISRYLEDSKKILENLDELDDESHLAAWAQVISIKREITEWNFQWEDEKEFIGHLVPITQLAYSLQSILGNINKIKKLKEYEESAKGIINDLNEQKKDLEATISQSKILSDDLKNKKINEIFEDDSESFKKIARRYEISFYMVLAFLFLYFFGWYVEIDTSNFKFKFAEQFHGNHTPTFYIQKISLLILSTTLAAFLLKRSFMNRRLADEAYRTAKELDALPRYMEGMPDEMKEKLRFDLAYKYFGNGIHHNSYTGGENLIHENIKANTEFLKSVKDLSSSNVDKAKSESDQ
ncbi:hypothetical protein [Acinetobacter courvalinii]|uniref:Uncharacterized protein n=1 Tax=Acinetobacter courvalinii TaxID=280147 RepID=A0AA42L8R2_9GAMM|nr:hypothetical protein [Acinetobacter courvalinii]MDH0565433.1 hypothetical protein [Acinetobacter courvalinii]